MFDNRLLKNAKSIKLIVPNTDLIVDSIFIKRLRNKLNLSKKSFAIAIGVSVSTIEEWEKCNFRNLDSTTKKLIYLIDKHEFLIKDLYDIQDNRDSKII